MAEFCNICTSGMANTRTDIASILMNLRALSGGDFKPIQLFHTHIAPNIEEFLNDQKQISVGGICEGCGLIGLTVEKKNSVLYLVFLVVQHGDWETPIRFRVATIDENNGLKSYWDGLNKLYDIY